MPPHDDCLRRYFGAIFLVGNHWISATTQRSILGIRVVVQSSSRFVHLQLGSIMIMFFDYIVYYIYHIPMIVFMIISMIMLILVLSIYVHLSYTLRSTLKMYDISHG